MATSDNLTIGELLQRLEAEGSVTATEREAAQAYVANPVVDRRLPWFIHVMLGASAWVATVLFVVALALLRVFDDEGLTFLLGVVLLAPGVVLSRIGRGVFLLQLALATMALGQLMIVIATVSALDFSHELIVCGVVICVLAAITTVLSPLTMNRFLGPLVGISFLASGLYEDLSPHAIHFAVAVCTVVAGAIFTCKRTPRMVIPLGYAAVVAALGTVLFLHQYNVWDRQETPLWPLQIIMGIALLAAIVWAAGKDHLASEPVVCALILSAALALVTAPGLLASLALMTIGCKRRNRLLTVIGAIHLPVFVAYFYYALNIDLLTKSGVLAGCGVILLLARWGLSRRPWAQAEANP